jgi:hypothetical protein
MISYSHIIILPCVNAAQSYAEAAAFIKRGPLGQKIYVDNVDIVSVEVCDRVCYQGSSNALSLPVWMDDHVEEDAMIASIAEQSAPCNALPLLVKTCYRGPVSPQLFWLLGGEPIPPDRCA